MAAAAILLITRGGTQMDLERAMKNPGATFGTPEVLRGLEGSEQGTKVRDP